MLEVKAIENAVKALPPQDLAEFRRWFAEFDLANWDQKIETDLSSGKLDGLLAEAKAGLRVWQTQVTLRHTASKRFWRCHDSLPREVQALSKRNFDLLRQNPAHTSLQFKLLGGGKMYSVRVGLYYRALGLPQGAGVHWFWIGTHADYDKLVAT